MLRAYGIGQNGQTLERLPGDAVENAIWIDLYSPQLDEIARVEALGVSVPSESGLGSIELSHRIYHDAVADYLTVATMVDADHGSAQLRSICFIVTKTAIISVRYGQDSALDQHLETMEGLDHNRVLIAHLDNYVGVLADRLEHWGERMRAEARGVFRDQARRKSEDLSRALVFFGRAAERLSLIHLSLSSVERVVNHLAQVKADDDPKEPKDPMIRRLERDLAGILAHTDFLASRASSNLDATLGLIDLDQNKSVSMLSAVVSLFAPATLIASVYGMNFERMPELHQQYGFALALGSMLLSAFVTFLFFRWRGWM